ncbi:MAG: class I SAM-dependent methyltransferase [Patescibacteria group bacterium]
MTSTERFGYEWNKYSHMDPIYESQFRNWIGKLTPNDFKDKNVLDVGCGMGRNSYWALKYGARYLTAFDADQRSVDATKNTLKDFDNAKVLFKNIYDITWNKEFDFVFSIGVVHHLEHPKIALKHLVQALVDGGTLLVWVYGYEGNEWIVRYVNPIRKFITSRLPVGLVHVLSYICSVPLWMFVKIFKGPSAYLKQLSSFQFWHIHNIVFDQLIPEVANYWRIDEVEELFKVIGLKNVDVYAPANKSGWIIVGKK